MVSVECVHGEACGVPYAPLPSHRGTRCPGRLYRNAIVNNIIYIVGLIVIVGAVLGYFGLR